MAVTISYSFNFVKNLDLAPGVATESLDATSLANGGFAVSGVFGGLSGIEVFSKNATFVGSTTSIGGIVPVIDQLSNGNIAIVTSDPIADIMKLRLTTQDGVSIDNVLLASSVSTVYDIAALSGGGYWLVRNVESSSTISEIIATIGNSEGSVVGSFNLTILTSDFARSPSAVGLDNGNVAVAWKDAFENVTTAVFSPLGDIVGAPAPAGTTPEFSKLSMTATAKGFALAFADNTWGTSAPDITLKQYDFDGTLLLTSNVSNPSLSTSKAKEAEPAFARLSNDFLGVTYKLTVPPADRADPAVIDTITRIIDPKTGTPLATKNIMGGEPSTDEVGGPAIAGFANGGVAVFHRNITDNAIDGEHLQVIRTTTGDAARNNLVGDSLADLMNGGPGNDILRGLGNTDSLDAGPDNDNVEGGRGCDTMTGGRGSDVFVYLSAADSPAGATCDRITDFRHLTDKISLKAIDAKTNTLGNNSFIFKGTLPFNAEGQVRAVQSGLNTVIEINTTGATGAEMTIQLDKVTATSLSLADFFF